MQDSRGRLGFVASIRAWRFVPLPEMRTVRRVLGCSAIVGWLVGVLS